MANLPPSIYFEPMCVFACEMALLNTAHQWVFTLPNLPVCLLIGGFCSFTFQVDIIMCEFDPLIMMLAGDFAHYLIQFLHNVDGFYNLVCFFQWLVLVFPFHI